MPVQVAEDLLCQLHGGGADGHRPFGEPGLGADPLRDGDGLLDQLVQNGARGLGLEGDIEGVLELSQDLRLSQHHGVEARGHAEGVAHALGVGINVERLLQVLRARGRGNRK